MSAAEALLRSVPGAPGQAHRLLRLHTPLGEDVLVAERLEGWESVDAGGFRFVLTALSTRVDLPLGRLLGGPVLVQMQQARDDASRRPFHGHVMSVERVGSDGGLARYRLVVEPWLSFLRFRQDSYVFRDATAIEIVEQVLSFYNEGAVVAAWCWDLRDRSIYRRRSLCSQYAESDFAFVTRLLAEEGIFYWFEHGDDVKAPGLGSHTMVLADHNEAFRPGEARIVRYQRDASPEQADAVQRWTPVRRWRRASVSRASWDYRGLRVDAANASASGSRVPAVDDDTDAPYAWADRAHGQRRTQQRLDALRVDSDVHVGTSNFRGLAPGATVRLAGHPTQIDEPLVCLRVHHAARNNFSAEMRSAMKKTPTPAADGSSWQMRSVAEDGEANAYENRFLSMSTRRAYRPSVTRGNAPVRWVPAFVTGAQTAVVTGQESEPIHTDRDHRVIVQRHWQRGRKAASRLDHPRASNAPADARSGTWARVLTPVAGADWGANFLPRVGQEVWVDHLEGDIDRPVVIAGLYNGRGCGDAPHNQVSGGPSKATGNAAPWFAGNGHPAVLSGFRTQDLAASRSGTGGFRELQFDDTSGQGHVRLATTDYDTRLALGHLKRMEGNHRREDLGYGVELATQAQGALRAGAGLLVASERGDRQMDAGAPRRLLDDATALAKGLADVARKQQVQLSDESASSPPQAVARQQALSQELASTGRAAAPGGALGDKDRKSAWGKSHLLVHGRDGLVATTPADHVLVSGADTVLTAGRDLGLVAQGQLCVMAGTGLAIYAQGDAPPEDRRVQTTGIVLAAAADVDVRVLGGPADLVAEKALVLSSAEGGVNIGALRSVLLAAGGAYLKLEGGNIEIGAPGDAEFKGVVKELAGPRDDRPGTPQRG